MDCTRYSQGSRVLVRVDANVVVKRGIADVSASGRIARSVPEIQKLLKRDARVILVTHFGRPTGHEKKFSVAPLAKAYATLLGKKLRLQKTRWVMTRRSVLQRCSRATW